MEAHIAIPVFAVLAHATRLPLFPLRVTAGPEGIAAGEPGERLHLPAATASFHLRELRHAGLATRSRRGRNVIHAADNATMNGLITFLTEDCCRGMPCLPAASRGEPRAAGIRAPKHARRRT